MVRAIVRLIQLILTACVMLGIWAAAVRLPRQQTASYSADTCSGLPRGDLHAAGRDLGAAATADAGRAPAKRPAAGAPVLRAGARHPDVRPGTGPASQ